MRVCMGGTFDPFHVGHRKLLAYACSVATELFVGVTSSALAKRPDRTVRDVAARIARVEDAIRGLGFEGEYLVRELLDASGPAATGDYQAIVVSPETVRGATHINDARRSNGLPPLEIHVVPHARSVEGRVISATRVASGDLDQDGVRMRAIRVAVGSANEAKLEGVRLGLEWTWPDASFELQGFQVDTQVPEQPVGGETMAGAMARAREALLAWPDCDLAIGLEAGLIEDPFHGPDPGTSEASVGLDIQACAVLDPEGWMTRGTGPGFQYPPDVYQAATSGRTVSEVLGPEAGDPRIGSTTGAIGYLTGNWSRGELSAVAVRAALVPRVRAERYFPGPRTLRGE